MIDSMPLEISISGMPSIFNQLSSMARTAVQRKKSRQPRCNFQSPNVVTRVDTWCMRASKFSSKHDETIGRRRVAGAWMLSAPRRTKSIFPRFTMNKTALDVFRRGHLYCFAFVYVRPTRTTHIRDSIFTVCCLRLYTNIAHGWCKSIVESQFPRTKTSVRGPRVFAEDIFHRDPLLSSMSDRVRGQPRE